MMVKADKTTNLYAMSPQHYADLTHKNITKTYKKSTQSEVNDINNEARLIADGINLSNRVEKLAEKDVFNTLKDHKPNFKNTPTCRLINPTRSELGQVNKRILERIIKSTVNCNGSEFVEKYKRCINLVSKYPGYQKNKV